MLSVSITTESHSKVFYEREADSGLAMLKVEYRIPTLQADYCRGGGWAKTLHECAIHELEAHQGLLREAEEELFEVVGQPEPGSGLDLGLKIDGMIAQVASRLCKFCGEKSVLIPAGEFRDEWRLLTTLRSAPDWALVQIAMLHLREKRTEIVAEVYQLFAKQAAAHDLRN